MGGYGAARNKTSSKAERQLCDVLIIGCVAKKEKRKKKKEKIKSEVMEMEDFSATEKRR